MHMCVVRLEWRCSRMRARSCPARNLVVCTCDRVFAGPAGVLLAVSRLVRAVYWGNHRDLAHYPGLLFKLRKRVSSALTGSEAAANAARSPVRGVVAAGRAGRGLAIGKDGCGCGEAHAAASSTCM